MKVEKFESDDEALLAELIFPDVGTIVAIMAPIKALNGNMGPTVFETPDPERTVVAWPKEQLAQLLGEVDSIEARQIIFGNIAYHSYRAVTETRKQAE
jgi:hypothetical protein